MAIRLMAAWAAATSGPLTEVVAPASLQAPDLARHRQTLDVETVSWSVSTASHACDRRRMARLATAVRGR